MIYNLPAARSALGTQSSSWSVDPKYEHWIAHPVCGVCWGEKAGGCMGLCKALGSKIRVNSAAFPSLGSSKAAKPSPQHLFLEQGMWV